MALANFQAITLEQISFGFPITSDELTISEHNTPFALTYRNTFGLTGIVTSAASNITYMTVGVYDSKETMMVTGKEEEPINAKTADINKKFDKFVKFGNLEAGNYVYKVTASNNTEKDKILVEQKFTVYVKNPNNGDVKTEETIWNFFKNKGFNEYAVAGFMGNFFAESDLRSNNLQDKKEGIYDDTSYTTAVDGGSYNDFANDGAGYGLAQWSARERKEGLLEAKENAETSISDLEMQLYFVLKELNDSKYKSLKDELQTASSVQEASDIVLTDYEKFSQSDSVKSERASYGQYYYDKYANSVNVPVSDTLSIAEYSYPTTLTEGKTFILKGTVTSAVSNIAFMTVGVYDTPTSEKLIEGMGMGMMKPINSNKVDIKTKFDDDVKFDKLPVGTYYYRVSATNSSETKELVNKKFTVTANYSKITALNKSKMLTLKEKVLAVINKIQNSRS
jgi:hypothetical protein